ncbi:MFS transporter [Gracilinema caldarium]|uniref:MFS transporter n=1 Tax=Gracilinema caldarium TaxID=215591 RepID=UPI0026EFC231|nr:MFS transporter [Gracilinema caldarium]
MEYLVGSPFRRRDEGLYFLAVMAGGLAVAMVDSSFNNFLAATWDISGLARSSLELPRELPGFLNAFVAALLAFLPGRRIGAFSFLLQALGIYLLASFSATFGHMTFWLFTYSLGLHLFLPLQQSIALELASSGAEGALLGKANALRNLAQIAGGAFVFIAFGFFKLSFAANFLLAALVFAAGALALFGMSRPVRDKNAEALVFKRRYGLFYILSILYGTRKQLFITFAPWVIVSVYHKPTSIMAALYFAGGIAGVLFQPFIGRAVDKRGERFMLGLEALLLIPVCFFYGFAKIIFPEAIAFIIVCLCYVADSLLLSFSVARSVWMKKIAEKPGDIAPTLAMGVSIDHIFSIAVALLAGLLWDKFGYQWVFLAGAGIAVINFIATRFVRVPDTSAVDPLTAEKTT